MLFLAGGGLPFLFCSVYYVLHSWKGEERRRPSKCFFRGKCHRFPVLFRTKNKRIPMCFIKVKPNTVRTKYTTMHCTYMKYRNSSFGISQDIWVRIHFVPKHRMENPWKKIKSSHTRDPRIEIKKRPPPPSLSPSTSVKYAGHTSLTQQRRKIDIPFLCGSHAKSPLGTKAEKRFFSVVNIFSGKRVSIRRDGGGRQKSSRRYRYNDKSDDESGLAGYVSIIRIDFCVFMYSEKKGKKEKKGKCSNIIKQN